MPVITMSREIGSGAAEVANRLCTELGLVAFDKRLMLRVASEAGLSDQEIVDYSEETYNARGFFQRLFSSNRPVAEVSTWAGGGASGVEHQVRTLDEEGAIALVRATVNAAYVRGNVVIIGRGSQAILENSAGVLHVRIVAPFEERIHRLQAEQELTAPQARRLAHERDRATADYVRTFYHANVDDPTLYHMVLNTGNLGIIGCVDLIKAAVSLMERPTD